jgi:hypothetical protein
LEISGSEIPLRTETLNGHDLGPMADSQAEKEVERLWLIERSSKIEQRQNAKDRARRAARGEKQDVVHAS